MANQERKGAVAAKKRKKLTHPPVKKETPEVVYTQPHPLTKGKLVLHLLTVAAVVVALMFCLSIFFKVETIQVSGNNKYTAWDIAQASGIQEGEGLLNLSRFRAYGKILNALPYVKDVRIGISLPDTVHIVVTEYEVTYAMQDQDDNWYLVTADGKVVQNCDKTGFGTSAQILGVKLQDPQPGKQAQAVEEQPAATGESQESAVLTISNREKLGYVLTILSALEKNGIIGKMASVDVTDPANIVAWYTDRFRVELGDSQRLEYKITYMARAIQQMADYQSGILDVSFRIREDGFLTGFN